jgi:predicted glycosyl hydrolase (DUF1957 family)
MTTHSHPVLGQLANHFADPDTNDRVERIHRLTEEMVVLGATPGAEDSYRAKALELRVAREELLRTYPSMCVHGF